MNLTRMCVILPILCYFLKVVIHYILFYYIMSRTPRFKVSYPLGVQVPQVKNHCSRLFRNGDIDENIIHDSHLVKPKMVAI